MDSADRVEALFQNALRVPAGERAAFVEARAGGDVELRAEVESLLAHHERAEEFLATSAAHGLGAPTTIGAFRVLRELGSGGMGVVYLAEQAHPRREVALKVVRPGFATPNALRRFEHEAEALARLQHAGIAAIYEAGTADYGLGPQPYFAMEYIRGAPLLDFAAQRALGTRQRLALLAEACEAVAHAHSRGVIHRDLKPSNLLVDEAAAPAQVKVLDFGVARVTGGESRATSLRTDVGQVVGTLAYMSPEQASGEPDAIDARSDVYSLGVLGYELLCGQLPLEIAGQPLHEALRRVREDEPTPISHVAPLLRGDVETILARALEKDVSRRYASASALAADLRRYLADRPIEARPASRWYVANKFVRRNKALVAGLVAVILALGVGLAGTSWQAIEAADARDRADDQSRRVGQERDRADRQARRATAVVQFQQDMLARIRPQADGRDVKLADVLDAAAASLPGEFADDAEIEASVRETLGVSYHSLGLLPEADEQFARAHALFAGALGERAEDTLEALVRRSQVAGERGDSAASLQLAREAYDVLAETAGAESRSTLIAELHLASALNRAGDSEQAERIARGNLAARRRVFGERNAFVASAAAALGDYLWREGKLAEAEPRLREALEIGLETDGERHPASLARMSLLASCLRHRGELEEAEQLYRRALEVGQALLGAEHIDVLTWKNNLAGVLQDRKRFEEAEPLLRDVVEARVRVLGATHEDTLVARNNLALLESNLGRYAEAEEQHRQTLAAKRERFGDDHRSTVMSLHNLALALLLQGDLEGALPIFREAAERAPRALAAGHWQIASYRESYGACLAKLQRTDEAEHELTAALEAMRASFPDTDARVVSIAGRLCQLYTDVGATERADELRAQFGPKR